MNRDKLFSRLGLGFSIAAIGVSVIACYIRGLDGKPGERGQMGQSGRMVTQKCLPGRQGKQGIVSTAFFNVAGIRNTDEETRIIDTSNSEHAILNRWPNYQGKNFDVYCIRGSFWRTSNNDEITNMKLNVYDSKETSFISTITLNSEHFIITIQKSATGLNIECFTGTAENAHFITKSQTISRITLDYCGNMNAYEVVLDVY